MTFFRFPFVAVEANIKVAGIAPKRVVIQAVLTDIAIELKAMVVVSAVEKGKISIALTTLILIYVKNSKFVIFTLIGKSNPVR
jgi:hypothetical protein